MNIEERREHIIKTNNNAQSNISAILEESEKRITEININKSLSGDIDLSIIKSMGFSNITKIVFVPGEITNIINFPNNLKVLICADQLLTELENIPKSLEELDCGFNYCKRLDFAKSTGLKKVNISNNRLTEIINLPEKLEELICDNNNIIKIDLINTKSLRVLHCSNNKTIILENIPPSLVDFKSENNPFITMEYERQSKEMARKNTEEVETEINYIEGINKFFKLKKKYEDINHKNRAKIFRTTKDNKLRRRLLKQYVPKCINCNRPGGSIFGLKDSKYSVRCNSSKLPLCNIKIEIFNGEFENMEELLYLFRELIIKSKNDMIIQKLDTLFSYIEENQTARIFKQKLEEYNENAEIYKELTESYNELYHNENRNELRKRKMRQIYIIMESTRKLVETYENNMNDITILNNNDILRTAVELQINELLPEIHNLQLLKYDSVEMVSNIVSTPDGQNSAGNDNGGQLAVEGQEGEGVSITTKWNLIQRLVKISNIDYTFGSQPEIINYRLS